MSKLAGVTVATILGGILILGLAISSNTAVSSPGPDIVLDGHRDAGYILLADDPPGDLAVPGPGGWPGTYWTDQTALYVAGDGINLYIYLDLPDYARSVSSGEIGLAIDTTGDVPGSGGAADPWGGALTFAYDSLYHNVGTSPVSTTHTVLPDYVIRGNIPGIPGNPPDNNNGWTELRRWDGSAWQGAGTNWGGIPDGGQVGTHIAYANNEGVELAIPWADLGLAPGSAVHLEFFATQKGSTKGAFDTVPSDDQSGGWDDATVQRHLASYGGVPEPTATPGGPTVTPTPTFTPGPSPTPTPTAGPGPCSGAAPGDGSIVTVEIYHNSRKPAYREPFGPIPQDGFATLRLRACHGDVQRVQAMVWKTGDPLASPSNYYTATVAAYDPGGPYDLWEVQVPALPGALIDQWYQFKVVDGGRTGYYHVLATWGNSGPGAWSDSLIDRSWKLGTYLAGFDTPDWVPDAVIYQIFPDRFRNGNPANDPLDGTTKYGPTTCNGGPCVVDLHSSWLDLPTTPPFGVDFFGGDLQGVLEKIDEGYFDDLGINTIYFNPIFEASSNHGYDTNDYYAIRSYFGTDQTFADLVDAANAHGIRLVLDGVFNHVGSDSRYVDGYGLNRWGPPPGACEAEEPFRSWIATGSSGQGTCTDGWGWHGWWGFETIPELNEIGPVKDFFYRGGSPQSPGGVPVADYWIDRGASGWRFDVAQDISHPWFQEMRAFIKAHDSATWMMGEVTGGCDWGLYAQYLHGDELDGVMNYCFRDWIVGWANGGAPSSFDGSFNAFRESFPRPAFYATMNLVDSHDSTRVLRLLNDDKTRLKLLVLLQMTLPGAPSVYYGDEVGVTGGGDPDCRRTYPWADQGGSPDTDLLAHYRQVIGIRRAHSALRGGEFETLLVDDAQALYAFIRWDVGERVVVVLNNGPAAQTAVVPVAGYLENGTVLTDTLAGGAYTVVAGSVTVPVNARWGAILVTGGTPALLPDLAPSYKAAAGSVRAGDALTYTIVLQNSGDAAAQAALTDTLPASVTVEMGSLPGGMTCAGRECAWNGPVAVGAQVALPFRAIVDSGVPSGTLLLNVVDIADGAGRVLRRTVGTRVEVPPPAPDLSSSSKEAPVHVVPGGVLTYTLVLRNVGEVAAGALLTDVLPAGVTVVTASLPGGMSCGGGACVWGGTVAAGAEVRLSFQARADTDLRAGTVLTNEVVVNDGAGVVLTRRASTLVSCRIYLPLVSR